MTPVKFYGGPANGDQLAMEHAPETLNLPRLNPSLAPWLMGAGMMKADFPGPFDFPILHHQYVATGGTVTSCVWRSGRWCVCRGLFSVYRYVEPMSAAGNSLDSFTTGD